MAASESNSVQWPIFVNLAPQERQQVLQLFEHETYPEGEMILCEGKSTQYLWIIVRGCCEVLKMGKNGFDQQLDILEPGAIFGEMSFFQPAPHSASVRTLSDVEVMRLSREKFDQLLENGTTAAYKIVFSIVTVLAKRLRKMDEWVRDLVEQSGVAEHREEWQEFRVKLYSDWRF